MVDLKVMYTMEIQQIQQIQLYVAFIYIETGKEEMYDGVSSL